VLNLRTTTSEVTGVAPLRLESKRHRDLLRHNTPYRCLQRSDTYVLPFNLLKEGIYRKNGTLRVTLPVAAVPA
jgi:hypothetical protein